jgi:hypothetical protein
MFSTILIAASAYLGVVSKSYGSENTGALIGLSLTWALKVKLKELI